MKSARLAKSSAPIYGVNNRAQRACSQIRGGEVADAILRFLLYIVTVYQKLYMFGLYFSDLNKDMVIIK